MFLNMPEFRSKLLNFFFDNIRIKYKFTKKDKPHQNGIAKSFMDEFRAKCLNLNVFRNIAEAKEIIGNYVEFYNNERPHCTLNYRMSIKHERNLNANRTFSLKYSTNRGGKNLKSLCESKI